MSARSDISPLLVRIPASLKQWLAFRAETNNRSMSGELLALMKAAQRAEQSTAEAV